MTQHTLQGRSENEILWFQRRSVVKAAAAWAAMGGLPAALAQQRSNVVQMTGDTVLNGLVLQPGQVIQTGDQVTTGPGSNVMFVIGNAAFMVRQNSSLSVERGETLNAVSLLRLVTGGVVSVWGRGNSRSVVMPTLTAGIRGTGVYAEVLAQQNNRNYFCNCYGTVDLDIDGEKRVSTADYHQSFLSNVEANGGSKFASAKAINHTDEELEFLAKLINQRPSWQISGKKGNRDGTGKSEY